MRTYRFGKRRKASGGKGKRKETATKTLVTYRRQSLGAPSYPMSFRSRQFCNYTDLWLYYCLLESCIVRPSSLVTFHTARAICSRIIPSNLHLQPTTAASSLESFILQPISPKSRNLYQLLQIPRLDPVLLYIRNEERGKEFKNKLGRSTIEQPFYFVEM